MLKILSTNQLINKSVQIKCEKALDDFLSRKDIGFPFLCDRENLWTSTQFIGESFRSRFQTFVIVGIGGSSLGGLAISEAFLKNQVLFLDNVDCVQFKHTMSQLKNLATVGWVFISKSGTTIETLATLDLVDQIYKEAQLDLAPQSIVITEDKDNSLGQWAHRKNVPRLVVPNDVGGRFSVLSPVGMLPAYLMGLDIESFKKGAQEALQSRHFTAELMTHFVQSFQREEWITLFWNYSSEMKSFGGWVQQLWCESLAKKVDNKNQQAPRVSTAIWATGACDQHSILQQLMEGHKDKFVIFLRYANCETSHLLLKHSQFKETEILVGKSLGQLLGAEAKATQEGLSQEGVSTMTLFVPEMNEKTLGYLFMTMQLVVAGLGEYLDINAFNQPGVELGKILAKKILAEQV